jgi:DNA-binding NarL/FixJ family response regulator
VRCLIVDDNRRFLDAARGRLESQGLLVVGVASNGSDAVQLSQELKPDVTLLDIDLGDESGFEVARRLQVHDPSPIIMISTHAEQDYRDLIVASSALGFLSKADLSAAGILNLLGSG